MPVLPPLSSPNLASVVLEPTEMAVSLRRAKRGETGPIDEALRPKPYQSPAERPLAADGNVTAVSQQAGLRSESGIRATS
ncbi:hypothetical protein SKAU_G00401430 [Synaphobranchus kaupii]|uniref:Uncharacterized protein n=1 Tax=Synaphobranchus kaupii TaxID=118154 RepID=A0A9Q1E936_SYNKA|nr:hypothetical protein SKAU_G00401430 [Synaphobranchus kaupii]